MSIDWSKVKVEGNAHVAADYLKKNPDMARDVFEDVHRTDRHDATHFEIPHDGIHKDISHHYTMVHEDGQYIIRPKEHHMF